MSRLLTSVAYSLVTLLSAASLSAEPAEPSAEPAVATPITPIPANEPTTDALKWHDDYGRAYEVARTEGRMLLINFVPSRANGWQQELERAIAANPAWQEKLRRAVLLRLPQDAQIASGGNSVRLLSHPSFREMHGQAGIAVLDLADPKTPYYGRVVSAFPFMTGKYYRWRADYLPVILDLPPGTITQRTMVWAVRVHPERPASTAGTMDGRLASAAQQHCEYQARIGVQGHHRWAGRFQRLRRLLGGGAPVEIVAESWPGQNMIDSCVDCVASWRYSSGHWNAVRTPHSAYGYDIRLGRNGIWYGTGIFTNY